MIGTYRHTLWIIILVLIQAGTGSTAAWSQEPPTTITLNDTTETGKLITLAKDISETYPDSSITLLQEAVNRSKQSFFYNGVVTSLSNLAVQYLNKGQYDKSLAAVQEAILYSKGIESVKVKVPNLFNIMSTVYQMQGNYMEASRCLYKAIWTAQSLSFPPDRMASYYNNIGVLLQRIGQMEQGMHYLEQAERIARNETRQDLLATTLMNTGIGYAMQKDWHKSDSCFLAALQIVRGTKGMEEIYHNILLNLGAGYSGRGQNRIALSYLKQALNLRGKIVPYYLNGTLIELGHVYYSMEQYEQAERYLMEALQNGSKAGLNNDMKESHNLLAHIYDKQGDFKKAFAHQRAYLIYKDSIEGREKLNNIAQLEYKYQSVQKDKDLTQKKLLISYQDKQLTRKNLWIISFVSGTIVLILLLIVFYRNYRHRQHLQQVRLQNIEREKQNMEKQLIIGQLKAMIKGEEKERLRIARELHDGIGGMLTAIKMHLDSARKLYPDIAGIPELNDMMHMLQDTSSEVRKTAHNLMPDILVRYHLEQALMVYCENLSKGSLQIDVQFQGDLSQLDKATELLLYRMAQELLQNVVKHANATYAIIQVMLHNGQLSVMVEDNGSGFNVKECNNGFGLENLKYRVQALEGVIAIESGEEQSTTVYISFDYNKLKERVAV